MYVCVYMNISQFVHSEPCGADKCLMYEIKEVAPKEDKINQRKSLIFRYCL